MIIAKLVRVDGELVVEATGGARPKGFVMAVAGGVEVLIGLAGHVDPVKEKERVERQLKKVQKDIEMMEKRLSLPSFVAKAPPEVVVQAKGDLAALQQKKAHLEEALSLVDEL